MAGWLNHELAPLPGIDVVFNLETIPWPFSDGAFDEIRMINVLEHLTNTVASIEELHRVCDDGAVMTVRVPYWNSPDMITDPTHKSFFNENSFDFFDPGKRHCQERPYYSKARFRVQRKHYYVRALYYWRVSSRPAQIVLERLARHLGGIIWVLEFELVAVKANGSAGASG
jgi:SAM-dependent methyltransferase